MSNEKNIQGSASTSEGQTAAQIMEQIKEKERELKASSAAKPVEQAPEPEPSQPSDSPEPAASPDVANKPPQAAPESGAGAVPGPTGSDKPEWKTWIEKKGFKSTEDMVRSMRELERELTRSRQGNGANAPQPAQPEPSYAPPPRYSPPPAPNIEELAKRYNLDPDDFNKVAPLAADIAATQVAQRMAPMETELNRLRRDVARSHELQGLKEDPAFADPRVQFEMHQILQANPSILQIEPAPYRHAFNEAMRNIGRRILEGSLESGTQVPPVSGTPGIPLTPPRTAGGSGSGSTGTGAIQPSRKLSQEAFNRLPAAEQRKILSGMGLVNEQEA